MDDTNLVEPMDLEMWLKRKHKYAYDKFWAYLMQPIGPKMNLAKWLNKFYPNIWQEYQRENS